MKHTICCMVENKFGVLARIAGLFSSRGFNIGSLVVGETEDPSISRMTIVVDADEKILEQVIKQLRKLIDVIKVVDLTDKDSIDRELVLVKVNTPDAASRSDVMQVVDIFRAKVVDVGQKSLVVEIIGDEDKVETMLGLLKPFGIRELARTGRISVPRR